jgi:hypothetical protein
MNKKVDITLAEYYERRYKEVIDTNIQIPFFFLSFRQFLNEMYLKGYLESRTITKILEQVYEQSIDEIHSDIDTYKKERGEYEGYEEAIEEMEQNNRKPKVRYT